MKILHILDVSLPAYSGYSFRTDNILREQKRRGFFPVGLTSPKHERAVGRTGAAVDRERINGIWYYRTRALTGLPAFAGEILLMARLFFRTVQVIQREKPDILHAHSPVLNAFPAIIAGWIFRKPVVYEIRAFWEDAAVDHGAYGHNSLKYQLVRRLETLACKAAQKVCVICKGLGNELANRGIPRRKIHVVYNGINPRDFNPPPDKTGSPESGSSDPLWAVSENSRKKVGFIGSFFRYEGLDLLTRAFADLLNRRDDIMLLLVGGGRCENEIRDLVENLGIGDHVLLPGKIPHSRISRAYQAMDVLVYPRTPVRLTELVTPLKPLEAMLMEKPALASDVGGHRELIQDGKTGMLFTAGSMADLKEKLSALLDDPDLRNRLGTAGKKWVLGHHTWPVTTAVYQTVYKQALSGKKGNA